MYCSLLNGLKNKLVVSCQALDDEPLHGSVIMGKMALAAKIGGAAGIRANTVEDIAEVKKQVDLPVIGIIKAMYDDSQIYITPTMKEVEALIHSEAEIIALDATLRKRPGDVTIKQLLNAIQQSGKLAMADISTFEEGINADKLGFDIISTTLSGYTPYTSNRSKPDLELIDRLFAVVKVPIAAEGNIKTPPQFVECLNRGAFFAVVGGAITRPQLITKDFAGAITNLN